MFVISSSYFVAGAVIEHGIIVKAADIIRYMVGWTELRVLAYCKKNGWLCERIPL